MHVQKSTRYQNKCGDMDVSQSKKFAGKRKLVTRLLFVVYQEHDEGGPAGMNRMQKKNDAQRKKGTK